MKKILMIATGGTIAKIMWVLGQTGDCERICELFRKVINLDRQEYIG